MKKHIKMKKFKNKTDNKISEYDTKMNEFRGELKVKKPDIEKNNFEFNEYSNINQELNIKLLELESMITTL